MKKFWMRLLAGTICGLVASCLVYTFYIFPSCDTSSLLLSLAGSTLFLWIISAFGIALIPTMITSGVLMEYVSFAPWIVLISAFTIVIFSWIALFEVFYRFRELVRKCRQFQRERKYPQGSLRRVLVAIVIVCVGSFFMLAGTVISFFVLSVGGVSGLGRFSVALYASNNAVGISRAIKEYYLQRGVAVGSEAVPAPTLDDIFKVSEYLDTKCQKDPNFAKTIVILLPNDGKPDSPVVRVYCSKGIVEATAEGKYETIPWNKIEKK